MITKTPARNEASTTASFGASEREEGLRRLQQSIKSNLSSFQQHTVKSCPTKTWWFSNEYSLPTPVRERVNLADSYARIPTSKPLSGYHVGIITGEGGLFQSVDKLADGCDLTLQLDCDLNPLRLCALLLDECRKTENYPVNRTDKIAILDHAIQRLQAENPKIDADDVGAIHRQFEEYIAGMDRNLFSSAECFAEFKRCQDHPVQQVCLNYFSKEAMTALAQTLKDHDAKVRFFNISNVFEYPEYFYQITPYDAGDDEGNINLTPSRYVQRLPFSDDAICAYSQLYGYCLFTATTTIPEMEDALHRCALSGRNLVLRTLAKHYDDQQLYTRLLQASAEDGAFPAALQRIEERIIFYGIGPSHHLPTRIFQFFAEYPIGTEHGWILRLTAARLTSSEVEELKVHKQDIKTLYVQSHPPAISQPPLFIKILDKITDEPTLAERDEPVDSTTTLSANSLKLSKAPSQDVP